MEIEKLFVHRTGSPGLLRGGRTYEDARPVDGLTVVERLEASLGRLEELVTFMAVLPHRSRPSRTARTGPQGRSSPTSCSSRRSRWGCGPSARARRRDLAHELPHPPGLSGAQFARVPADELLAIARTELTSSIEFLCMADADRWGGSARWDLSSSPPKK